MRYSIVLDYLSVFTEFIHEVGEYAYKVNIVDIALVRSRVFDEDQISKLVNNILELGNELEKYTCDSILRCLISLNEIEAAYIREALESHKLHNEIHLTDLILKDMGCYYDNSRIKHLDLDWRGFKRIILHNVKIPTDFEIAFIQYDKLQQTSQNSMAYTSTVKFETKKDKLAAELGKNGFFELPRIKRLSEKSKQKLVELLSENAMPYGIAMFDFLGFCDYLDKEHRVKIKADHILSKLYNEKAKDGTAARHLRHSLIKETVRYKACRYKEIVINDYQKLE